MRIPIRPSGVFAFPEVLLPAKSRTAMRLLASIPLALRKNRYQLAVRQTWEQQEMGRVTWVLAPDVRKKHKR